MKLTRISIKGLFGRFNHVVKLFNDDRITIIHGPNGCGKTTLLHLVQMLFNLQLDELLDVYYSSITLDFDDGAVLAVAREINDPQSDLQRPSRRKSLVFSLSGNKTEGWKYSRKASPFIERLERTVRRTAPTWERIANNLWRDSRDGEIISTSELTERVHVSPAPQSRHDQVPEWLSLILKGLQIHIIQTQRLLRASEGEEHRLHRPTVLEYSDDIIRQITQVLAQSFGHAQSLDRSFPTRVLNQATLTDISTEQIRSRYQDQQEKRKRLSTAGLITSQMELDLPSRDLGHTELRLLWTYLDDVDQKLSIFNDLLLKIEAMKDMLNSRFLYKSFQIDRQRGFVFKTDRDSPIPLEALSSGEQHELVLAYELLFRVKKGSLILIDEPELSLHVTWQHRFLEDLDRISKLVGLDFLVATHSPQIIHKRWDLAIALVDEEHDET
jgi:predicted ATP-dependent endonuclease of OLD family